MLRGTVRLFRVRGIPVGINWSWLAVFVLVFWSLAAVVFPAAYPDLSAASYVPMAAAATVLFFVSILAHELSHTLVALGNGVRVKEITLWLLGGASRTEGSLPTPRVELRVVAAGPAASAALALGFWGLAAAMGAAGWPQAARAVCEYLARINGLLLAFNVVPALPLDGGRLLHAVLWRRCGDRSAATISAAWAGRAFALMLVTIGLLDLLGEGAVGGMWLVLMGSFLFVAMQGEVFAAQIDQAVIGLRVRDLMTPDPITVAPSTSITAVARGPARRSPHGAYPVVDHGRLVGLLPLRCVGAQVRQGHGDLAVADVMLTGEQIPTTGPDDEVSTVLASLRRTPGRAVVVEPNGDSTCHVVGLLSTSDIHHAIEAADDRQAGRPAHRERPPQGRPSTGLAIWLVVGLMIGLAGSVLYHPPYVVIEPGEAFDITDDITISGPLDEPTGRYPTCSTPPTTPEPTSS